MRIFVKAKLRAKESRVHAIDGSHFKVSVKGPPVEGKANQQIVEALAEELKIPKSRITLVSGHTSKQKVFEVEK
jgi:uncharacterized protein (TIGR00251 family)